MRRWPLIFLVMAPLSAGLAVAEPGDRWNIAGDNVNLRRGPGSGFEIKLQLNQPQRVIERGREAEWRHVEVVGADGLLGWVHHSLLEADLDDRGTVEASPLPSVLPSPLPEPAVDYSPKTPVGVLNAFKTDPSFQDGASRDPATIVENADPNGLLDDMSDYVKRRDKLPKDPSSPRTGQSGREIISPVPIRNPGDQSRIPTELVLASSPEVAGIDVEAMEDFRDSVSYLNSRAWSVAGIKLFAEIEPIGGGVVQVKTTEEWFDVPKIGQTSYLNTLVDRWSTAKADGAPAGVMLVDPKGDLLMHQSKP
jgi:hypothetical protein